MKKGMCNVRFKGKHVLFQKEIDYTYKVAPKSYIRPSFLEYKDKNIIVKLIYNYFIQQNI